MNSVHELRRQWETTGDDRDHGRYLKALVEGGLLPESRLLMAAALGNRGARQVAEHGPILPEDFRDKIECAISVLTAIEAVRFAFTCAKRALPAWERVKPDDPRPRKALSAPEMLLRGENSSTYFESLRQGASQAAIESDYPEFVESMDPALARALHAANAAAHAALAAEDAADAEANALADEVLQESVSYTIKFSALSAEDVHAERAWQISELCSLLLNTS